MDNEVTFNDGIKDIKVKTVPLTIEETKESITEESSKNTSIKLLPDIGTIFSISGNIYKVVYINDGKNRFSASPIL